MESTKEVAKEGGKTTVEIIESIKDTPEFKELITNTTKQHWESNIGKEVKTIYDNIDGVFTEVLGVKKGDTTKTTEFLKAQLLEYKELKEKAKSTPDFDKILKDKESMFTAQIAEIQKTLQQKESELNNYKSALVTQKVASSLESELVGKSFNPAYSKDVLDELIQIRKTKVIANSVVLDNGGVIYYRDSEKTQPYLDSLGNPMKADKVVNEVFGSLFLEKKQGGNAQKDGKDVQAQGDAIQLDQSKITDKDSFYLEFNKAMSQKGFTAEQVASIEYLKIQKATLEAYKHLLR